MDVYLDGLILEDIAKMIGDNYTGSQLQDFFVRARLQCPKHDGTTKWRWVRDQLQIYNQSPHQIERVLLRIGNPLEYQGDIRRTRKAIEDLNGLLAIQGLSVQLDGVNPNLVRITPHMVDIQPDNLEFTPVDPPDFSKFIGNPDLEAILTDRWAEAQNCVNAECYLAAVIVMGSILEACLLSVMIENKHLAYQSKSAPKDRDGDPTRVETWSLNDLINVAHSCGWIQADAKDFSHALRDYRNMVHPWHQRQKNFTPDEDTCAICWEVAKATINDLLLHPIS